VVPSEEYNDVLVKNTLSGKRYYYPASQEFGFKLVNGGYYPGAHYLRESLTENKTAIERKILDTLKKDIGKALAGGR
jgi:hypothetical protein